VLRFRRLPVPTALHAAGVLPPLPQTPRNGSFPTLARLEVRGSCAFVPRSKASDVSHQQGKDWCCRLPPLRNCRPPAGGCKLLTPVLEPSLEQHNCQLLTRSRQRRMEFQQHRPGEARATGCVGCEAADPVRSA